MDLARTRALLFFALAGIGSAQQLAGGGVDGDTQSREVVPLFSRPVGDESRLVGCDGDIQTNQPNKGNERVGGTFPLRPQAQVGLPAADSAGSTPARLHQHQHRVHYRYDAHGCAWGWIECSDFGGGIMGPASERDAGRSTRKVSPATASAPYWRGQYRCTARTRIDAKGREWQGEECYWFDFAGARRPPKGVASFLREPKPACVRPANDSGEPRERVQAPREIPQTANGPVGAERLGLLPGERWETGSRTAREQRAERVHGPWMREKSTSNAPPTVIGVNAGQMDARITTAKSWEGSGSSANPPAVRWWQRHVIDTALHLGATSLDAASSWGRVELNPMLRSADGRFGAKGVAIKGAFALGVEVIKWRLAKSYPRERWVRALSLGPAVAFGGVAVRNWRVR